VTTTTISTLVANRLHVHKLIHYELSTLFNNRGKNRQERDEWKILEVLRYSFLIWTLRYKILTIILV